MWGKKIRVKIGELWKSDHIFPTVRYEESERIYSYGAACGKYRGGV